MQISMKKILLLLFVPLLIACSDDDSGKTNTGILFSLSSSDWFEYYEVEGATLKFDITIPKGQSWIVEDCPNWCAIDKKSSKWDEKIEITVLPNNELQGRTANIRFGIYDSDGNPVLPYANGYDLEINQKGKITGTWKKGTGDNNSIIYAFDYTNNYVFRQAKDYPDKFKINVRLDYSGCFGVEGENVNIDLSFASISGQYTVTANDDQTVARNLFNQLLNQFVIDNDIQFDEGAKPVVKPIIKDPLNYTIKILEVTKNYLLIEDPLRGGTVTLYPADESEKIY